jgi:membrane-bound serine protease (ClpP class)
MAAAIVYIVLLIVAALVLILVEILTPTFGTLGVLAVIALGGAVWQAFSLHPAAGWGVLIGMVFFLPAYLAILIRWLPRGPLGRRGVFLGKVDAGAGAGTPDAETHESLLGKVGRTETSLRPSGAVRLEGNRVMASAESGLIDKGQWVRVVDASGMNVVVRPCEPPTEESV